jgi:hypothetical protein
MVAPPGLLPGGRSSPIGRRGDGLGQAAWLARTLQLARLAAVTARPVDSAVSKASRNLRFQGYGRLT